MTDATRPLVISAPEPRTLELIFTADKLAELRTRYEIFETDAASVAGLDETLLARAVYVLGQPPIPSADSDEDDRAQGGVERRIQPHGQHALR